CHSVRSCWLPSRSLRTLVVARLQRVTAMPLAVYFVSGSFPRLPTRITLLIPRAMSGGPRLVEARLRAGDDPGQGREDARQVRGGIQLRAALRSDRADPE